MKPRSLILLFLPLIVGALYLLTLRGVATSIFAWAALGIALFGIVLLNVPDFQKGQAGGWALYAGGIGMFMQFSFNIVSQLAAGTILLSVVLIAVFVAESQPNEPWK